MGGLLCCFAEPVDFDGDINLFHFELHRAVGKGAFGKVRVVEHKKTKKLYALKYIEKAKCVKQKAVANIIQERQLLEEVDHPFVVNLRYAFQDDSNCFFVIDLMLGGDLRFHLERRGTISEEAVRFWVAEISCALSYLHNQGIMHRDMKPDNILLDILGHAHITDFNVAIHYSPNRQHTSVAGSLAYMAPEVCARRGYSWQADWWSLGVCAYELLFGRRPFEGRSAESLTGSIVKDPVRIPERAVGSCSNEGLQAVKQLLERNPRKRLGCQEGLDSLQNVRSHPWFASINWELLEDKDAQPPFVPDMRKANFDISHELDEFLMVEKPLTATKRKANMDIEKLAPELRQLEEQFTNFDFSKPRRMSYYPHNQPLLVPDRARRGGDTDAYTLVGAGVGTPMGEEAAGSRGGTPSPEGFSSHGGQGQAYQPPPPQEYLQAQPPMQMHAYPMPPMPEAPSAARVRTPVHGEGRMPSMER